MLDLDLFTEHIEEYLFADGEADGKWGIINKITMGQSWPIVYLWIAAAQRKDAPDKFYFRFILNDYPESAPDICLWDINKNSFVDTSSNPKGKNDVAIVFRHDTWAHGQHLYTAYERHALASHGPEWLSEYPSKRWKKTDSIFKITDHLFRLLNSKDYEGI